MSIRCASCHYDNDPTRVYCHSCGIKLERGKAPPPPTGYTHPTDAVRRDRAHIPWGKYLGFFARVFALAGMSAILAAALLPPRGVPPVISPQDGLSDRTATLLNDFAVTGGGFAKSADDVHQWLVSTVRFADSGKFAMLKPERVYSRQGEGYICIGLQASVLDLFSVYFEGDYSPVRMGQRYRLEPVRYSVGRLPLPVELGWPVQRQLAGLPDALGGSLETLSRASRIGISADSVSLHWAGQ